LCGFEELVHHVSYTTAAHFNCSLQFVRCRVKPLEFFVKGDVFDHNPVLLRLENIEAGLLDCYSGNDSKA